MRIGAYEVTRELGRGATAIVYAARGPEGQPVAVKLLAAVGPIGRVTARFQREVEALARLRHPGIVGFVEAGEHQGRPFLVTELVEGETLQARLDRAGALSPAATVELGAALADALAHAHAQGVLHRDLKPANVLLGLDGRPRLADFGLARDLEASLGSLTASGALVGTPGFWAPEQAQGAREAFGPATDVWGLGATLYAALTREPPFSGGSLAEVCVATTSEPATPPSRLEPTVPGDLEAVVLRCLEKAPTARHASADALARALRACQRPGRRARRARRSRLALVLGAAGGVTLVAAALAIVLARRQTPEPAPPVVVAAAPPATEHGPPAKEPAPLVEEPAPATEPAPVYSPIVDVQAVVAFDTEVRRLVGAGRFDEAQPLLDAAPDAWVGGTKAATAKRAGVRVNAALAARRAGRANEARRAFEDVVARVEGAPEEARDEALGMHVLALLGLGRVDAACDAVGARPAALRKPAVVGDLMSSLAELCPCLGEGPWRSPDPTGANDVARVLARLVAVDPRAPAWVHLMRGGVERARGNVVGADAAIRDALAALQPGDVEAGLSCAEWQLARARPADALPSLIALGSTPPDSPEPGASAGRRARLLLRLARAEQAIVDGDPVRASALLEGLGRDTDIEVARDRTADAGFVDHVAARRRLVDDDARVVQVRRLCESMRARSAAGQDPFELLAGLPAAVTSSAQVRLASLSARFTALDARPAGAGREGFSALVPEADALAEVYGVAAELQAILTRSRAGRGPEARTRARALLREFPGAALVPDAIRVAVMALLDDRPPGFEQPAWGTGGVDRAQAAAVDEYLEPWLPTQESLGRFQRMRWSTTNLIRLAAALVLLARARAAQGELVGAVEALACAAAIPTGAEDLVALERATLHLAALRDAPGARAALKGLALPPERQPRADRLLRLAAVEEALAGGDRVAARTLADALAKDEAESPSVDEGDNGASFPALVEAARRRIGP